MENIHYIVADDLGLNTVRVKGFSHVSLDLAENRAHALCGEDKSGRDELLLALAGRMLPTEGSLTVGGVDGRSLRSIAKVRRRAGLAFFEHVNEVEPALTVLTLTAAELSLAGKRGGRKAAEEYLDHWHLLGVRDERVSDLDRYTYDRFGIALGMAADPSVLVVSDIERDLTELESSKLASELCKLARSERVTVICGVIDYDLATHFDSVTCLSVNASAQRAARGSLRVVREVA